MVSLVIFLFSAYAAPWYVTLMVTAPLLAYNVRGYMRRDHKLYFITRNEYKKHYQSMENQYKYKRIYYGVLTAGSLVMMILALIDFMERMV